MRREECSGCQRPISIVYKEIMKGGVTCTQMCDECPFLKKQLHGGVVAKEKISEEGKVTGVCCAKCGTSFVSIQSHGLLGCPECYTVFEGLLIVEMISAHKVPMRIGKMQENTKKERLHVGRIANKDREPSSASRIASLNEALTEALKKENYEQAAWLRDQIKALTGI